MLPEIGITCYLSDRRKQNLRVRATWTRRRRGRGRRNHPSGADDLHSRAARRGCEGNRSATKLLKTLKSGAEQAERTESLAKAECEPGAARADAARRRVGNRNAPQTLKRLETGAEATEGAPALPHRLQLVDHPLDHPKARCSRSRVLRVEPEGREQFGMASSRRPRAWRNSARRSPRAPCS